MEHDPDPPWLVPDLICRGSIVVLAGEAGAGKSFLSYALALALASGRTFLGEQCQTTRVLYFDDENSKPESEQYLRMLWRGMGEPDIRVLKENLRVEQFTLTRAGNSWRQVAERIAEKFRPEFIVIDTAVSSCHIVNENDNSEAIRTLASLRSVKDIAGPQATLWILKHARLDTEAGKWTVRGAKAWVSATDATLMHSRYKGQARTDGLFNTQLSPVKRRVYSLSQELIIRPKVTEGFKGQNIQLVAVPKRDSGGDP